MAGLSELWSHFARWFAGSQRFQKKQIHQWLQKFNVETDIHVFGQHDSQPSLSPFEAKVRGQTLGWFREVRYINPPSSWWQLQYFWNFHPENWGNDPQFDEHIFQHGLVKNHQLLGGSSQWMYVVRITPPIYKPWRSPIWKGKKSLLGDENDHHG